jgi:hypothetical protein
MELVMTLCSLPGQNDPPLQQQKNTFARAKTAEVGFEASPSGRVTGKWGMTTTKTVEYQDTSVSNLLTYL